MQSVLAKQLGKAPAIMSAFTQILLIISYAAFGTGTAVVLSLFDVESSIAQLTGAAIFIVAWQLQLSFFNGKKDAADSVDMHRVEEIEKLTLQLQQDVVNLEELLSEQSEKGDEKDKKLVTELKTLQEFLLQVMQKETHGKKSDTTRKIAGTTPAAPEPEEQMTAEEIEELGLAPEEAALVVMDGGDDENDQSSAVDLEDSEATDTEGASDESYSQNEGQIAHSGAKTIGTPKDNTQERTSSQTVAPTAPSSNEVSHRKPPSAQPRSKSAKPRAPIRLIKREDQLLSVIKNSLSENRVDLYLQPIVSLPSRKTAHFECFSRVRDEEGRVVLPRQYLKVAETKGLISTIDNLLMFRLVQLVRRMGKRRPDVRFFLNMSRYSISDKEFLPQFIDFMISNDEFANRMVFEISQDDYLSLEDETMERLRLLGKKGFTFSMDMVTDFEQDFTELERSYFKYIKADISDILAANPEPGDIEDQKKYIQQRGMQLVASKIETEDMVIETLDSQIELAQGYLFGEPIASDDMDTDL